MESRWCKRNGDLDQPEPSGAVAIYREGGPDWDQIRDGGAIAQSEAFTFLVRSSSATHLPTSGSESSPYSLSPNPAESLVVHEQLPRPRRRNVILSLFRSIKVVSDYGSNGQRQNQEYK
uniref:Uncharacterized protein n=1 Tax=Oryza rufipogon TaxID=4529 RepID=A0A0E0NIH0_ORYRU